MNETCAGKEDKRRVRRWSGKGRKGGGGKSFSESNIWMKWGRKTNFEYRRRNQYPSVGCYLIDNYHTWYMGSATPSPTVYGSFQPSVRTLPLNWLCNDDDDDVYHYRYQYDYHYCYYHCHSYDHSRFAGDTLDSWTAERGENFHFAYLGQQLTRVHKSYINLYIKPVLFLFLR